jgi:tartrate dehydrogenase/decarboxylase / D-malate dehydrogenase
MKNYKIAVVPGDGIGHEIVPAALNVLTKVSEKYGFTIEKQDFDWGAGYYRKNGEFMPKNGLDKLKDFDAVLFGAVGLPEVDDTLPAKDYTFKVRTHFQQYVNYRPCRVWPGVTSPLSGDKYFDFIVVRENTEGEFVQVGSQYLPDSEMGMGVDTSIFTRKGIERIAHYAFKLALKRRKKVTYVTKSNTLINSLTYWDRVIEEVGQKYPDVELHKMYIDATSANFVLKPGIFDVVLTTNLFGDILSDLGGAIMGSLGLGGSGNINPERTFPSMFEPIHGSAPDIAGRGISNPYGTIWSVAIMLEHLGEYEAATNIMKAMDQATTNGFLSVDLGGKFGCKEISEAVINYL